MTTPRLVFHSLTATIVSLVGAARLFAADPAPIDPQIEASLKQNAEAFVAAFQKGDAKAVAAFWAPDGDYLNVDQQHFQGREAIEKVFAEGFAGAKGLVLRIDVQGLVAPTPDVVIEDGITSLSTPDGAPPTRTHYTNVHVKKDGKWLLQSVRETPQLPPSNASKLSGLEWAIGEWAENAKGPEVAHVLFEWAPEKNFILGYQEVAFNGVSLHGGSERIGWDPATKQIRSWNFQSDGGFGEGVWTQAADGAWSIPTSGMLADGKKVTATNSLTRKDADTVIWQSKNRTLDGKALPDTNPVTLNRVK